MHDATHFACLATGGGPNRPSGAACILYPASCMSSSALPEMPVAPRATTRLESVRREPFRLFFPLGLAIAAAGVVPWLTFGRGWTLTSPAATIRLRTTYRLAGRPDHEHAARRVADHLLRHRTEERPLEALAAVGAHHDRLDAFVLGGLDDHLPGRAREGEDLADLRAKRLGVALPLFEPSDRIAGQSGSRLLQ